MNTVVFDLNSEMDPVFRTGVQGLRLACQHVRKSTLYPGVPCVEDLQWELGPHTVTIHYRDLDTLSKFMDSVWGEFPGGYAVPPGYSSNEKDPEIYQTAKANDALLKLFNPSPGQEEQARRVCLVFSTVKPAYLLSHPEMPLREKLGCLIKTTKDDSDSEISNFVSMGSRNFFKEVTDKVKANKNARVWEVTFETKAKKATRKTAKKEAKTKVMKVQEFPRVPMTCTECNLGSLHPRFGIWNTVDAESNDPLRAFLLSFACLAHVHIRYTNYGILSLGLDFCTFEEFDKFFDRYVGRSETSFLLDSVEGNASVAALMLVATLGLPKRSYPVIFQQAKDATTLLNFQYDGRKEILGNCFAQTSLEAMDKARILHKMKYAPLTESKSVFDQIEENFEYWRPWYWGFSAMVGTGSEPFSYWTRDLVTQIAQNMGGSEMERQIREKMRWLTNAIRSSLNPNKDREFKRVDKLAEDFVVKQCLKPITNKQTLLMGIRTIVEKAGGPGFTQDELDYLNSMNPLLAREILILGAQLTNVVAKAKTSELGLSKDDSKVVENEGKDLDVPAMKNLLD